MTRRRTTFEQATLDLIAKAQESGESEATIKILQDALGIERKLSCRDDADRLFATHQYRGCRYGQLSTIADNPVVWPLIKSLSEKARSLLMLLMIITKTEYISISRSQLAEIVGCAPKRITATIRELVDATALEIVSEHTNNAASVYRISSALYRVGKLRRAKEDDIEAYFGDEMPDYDSSKEWLQILLRRMESTEYNSGKGWYAGMSDITIDIDGVATKVKTSVLQYYDPDSDKKNEPSRYGSDNDTKPDHEDDSQFNPPDYSTSNLRASIPEGIPGQMTIFDFKEDISE